MNIADKLKVVKMFQDKYPNTHVGGSLGLFLHGIDLKRDLNKSDIDLTSADDIQLVFCLENITDLVESSRPGDFNFAFRFNHSQTVYTKIDVRITPEPSFEVINYDGIDYNVSKVRDIIFWKKKYADNNVQKHIDDLIVINGGERPELIACTAYNSNDDFPF